jgi:hypothetical protein
VKIPESKADAFMILGIADDLPVDLQVCALRVFIASPPLKTRARQTLQRTAR